MAEVTDNMIDTWLGGESLGGDSDYRSYPYPERQAEAYKLFFVIGGVLYPKPTEHEVAYDPVYLGERDVAGRPGDASRRARVAVYFGSRMASVFTPSVTACEIKPGQPKRM